MKISARNACRTIGDNVLIAYAQDGALITADEGPIAWWSAPIRDGSDT